MSKSVILTRRTDKSNLQKEFLKAINGILDLTNRELELLNLLIEFDKELEGDTSGTSVINAANRKRVKAKLGITPDNLSRYISKFKQNGILVNGKVDGEMHINKTLTPDIIRDRVQITIVLKINNEENNI